MLGVGCDDTLEDCFTVPTGVFLGEGFVAWILGLGDITFLAVLGLFNLSVVESR